MAAVADRIGVTKPVLYACFASRHELIDAMLEREERLLLAGVLGALGSRANTDDPEPLLVAGFQALLEAVEQRAGSWRLVFAPEPDPAVAERFGRAHRLVAERVAAVMEPVLTASGTRDVQRKLPVLVELFMAAGDGAVRALIGQADEWTTADLGEFVGRTVFRAFNGA